MYDAWQMGRIRATEHRPAPAHGPGSVGAGDALRWQPPSFGNWCVRPSAALPKVFFGEGNRVGTYRLNSRRSTYDPCSTRDVNLLTAKLTSQTGGTSLLSPITRIRPDDRPACKPSEHLDNNKQVWALCALLTLETRLARLMSR
jgi:hypothetical protein